MPEQQPQVQPHELHVDSGWKQQAEREKEELAKKVGDAKPAPDSLSSTPSAGPSPRSTEAEEKKRTLPAASFELLVQQHVTSILLALGHLPDPAGGRPAVDLDLARLYIDLLILLREKTKGNRTESEERLITAAVYEMQMAYVKVRK